MAQASATKQDCSVGQLVKVVGRESIIIDVVPATTPNPTNKPA